MSQCIAVLFGGVSTEYIISLRSSFNIIQGLRSSGYEVICVGISKTGSWYRFDGDDQDILNDSWYEQAKNEAVRRYQDMGTAETRRSELAGLHSPRDWFIRLCGKTPDCIFPAVHGINCEDGSLQGFLQLIGLPYVGSGVLASAASMDKLHTKRILRDAGIRQCPFLAAKRADIEKDIHCVADQVEQEIGYPCFLKPSNGGSSVGTRCAADRAELIDSLSYASRFDRDVLIEPFIRAREIEVAVLGNHDLRTGALGEIATHDHAVYYDYQTKYFSSDGADVIIPASLPSKLEETILETACKAYQAIGCAGLARIDFFIDLATDALYLNEINTLPGFTPISVYPKAFEKAGMPLATLTSQLCQLAVSEYQDRKRQESVDE